MGDVKEQQVFQSEEKIIQAQRKLRGQGGDGHRLLGLALSGGGIRSASFSIGVLQALHLEGVFKRIDYLSTVSGGGYTGSALTWFDYLQSKTDQEWRFPFDDKEKGFRHESLVAVGEDSRSPVAADTELEGNKILNFIRLHGKYLTPGGGLSTVSLFAMVVRSSFYSAVVYFSLMVLIMTLLNGIGAFEPASIFNGPDELRFIKGLSYPNLAAVFFLGLFVALIIVSAVFTVFGYAKRGFGYAIRVIQQVWLGRLLIAAFFAVAMGILPNIYDFSQELPNTSSPKHWWDLVNSGWSSLALGVLGAAYQFAFQRKSNARESIFSGIRIWITACLLIFGLLYAAFHISKELEETAFTIWGQDPIWLLVAVVLIGGFGINLNLFELNRMYRDRLMETFLPNPQAISANTWEKASKADVAMIVDMCGDGVMQDVYSGKYDSIKTRGPYHLVNTNLILSNSKRSLFRSRGGDNFVISPAYCGGDALGWYKTEDVVHGDITLATAMSISGAALNPRAGVGGKGLFTNKLVSFMMGFFNIRLGFWIQNPKQVLQYVNHMKDPATGKVKKSMLKSYTSANSQPNLFSPGLTQGLLGWGSNEHSWFIELSDGGHFDNTGIYELVRRQVPLIILSQAGADPAFTLSDISTAFERVRVDFGVEIEFSEKELELEGLIPGSLKDNGFSDQHPLSQRGFAVAKIRYPDVSEVGYLILIKSVLTGDLPAQLYHYKSTNESFPNETTSDQFFDESQFEAYRELGYQLTKRMLLELKDVYLK